jgi:uncharacterized protein
MKKAICITAIIVIVSAMASWTAFAQATTAAQPAVSNDQPPTKEQLVKLFQLMRVQEQIATITKTMPALVKQQVETQLKQAQQAHPEIPGPTAEQQKTLMQVMDKFMGRAMNLITSEEMIADISAIYQKHLTRADVDGIIAFYNSTAGQHLLDKQPVIMQEYLPVILQRMQDRIKPLIDEMTKEIEGIVKPSASSAGTSAKN